MRGNVENKKKTAKIFSDPEPLKGKVVSGSFDNLYEGVCQVVVEVLLDLLLVDIGQQPRDRLEHEHQHQQDRVLQQYSPLSYTV